MEINWTRTLLGALALVSVITLLVGTFMGVYYTPSLDEMINKEETMERHGDNVIFNAQYIYGTFNGSDENYFYMVSDSGENIRVGNTYKMIHQEIPDGIEVGDTIIVPIRAYSNRVCDWWDIESVNPIKEYRLELQEHHVSIYIVGMIIGLINIQIGFICLKKDETEEKDSKPNTKMNPGTWVGIGLLIVLGLYAYYSIIGTLAYSGQQPNYMNATLLLFLIPVGLINFFMLIGLDEFDQIGRGD